MFKEYSKLYFLKQSIKKALISSLKKVYFYYIGNVFFYNSEIVEKI